jgi:hypothetical protein
VLIGGMGDIGYCCPTRNQNSAAAFGSPRAGVWLFSMRIRVALFSYLLIIGKNHENTYRLAGPFRRAVYCHGAERIAF